jgi:hypothetical protein
MSLQQNSFIWQKKNANLSELCRRFGIGRGYKIAQAL